MGPMMHILHVLYNVNLLQNDLLHHASGLLVKIQFEIDFLAQRKSKILKTETLCDIYRNKPFIEIILVFG